MPKRRRKTRSPGSGCFNEDELEARALSFKRGVAIPVLANSGRSVFLLSLQKIRIEKKERCRRRWAKKLARPFEWWKDDRKVVAQKDTHDFATDPERSLFVIQDRRVNNMTKSPRRKRKFRL